MVGEDGVFLIDDQYAVLSDKIIAAIEEISQEPIRFLINTHWHTEQFMEMLDRKVPPSPPKALPIITFNDTVTFYLNP